MKEYPKQSMLAWELVRVLSIVGSYTLGYQFWRGARKTDRLKYYKKLKKPGYLDRPEYCA